MKMRTTRVSTGIIGVVLICAGAVVCFRGEREARDLTLRREQILEARAQRSAEIEAEFRDPALNESRRAGLESELEACRSPGRTGIPGYFPYNARLFGYVVGGFFVLAGTLCLSYAAGCGETPSQPK